MMLMLMKVSKNKKQKKNVGSFKTSLNSPCDEREWKNFDHRKMNTWMYPKQVNINSSSYLPDNSSSSPKRAWVSESPIQNTATKNSIFENERTIKAHTKEAETKKRTGAIKEEISLWIHTHMQEERYGKTMEMSCNPEMDGWIDDWGITHSAYVAYVWYYNFSPLLSIHSILSSSSRHQFSIFLYAQVDGDDDILNVFPPRISSQQPPQGEFKKSARFYFSILNTRNKHLLLFVCSNKF